MKLILSISKASPSREDLKVQLKTILNDLVELFPSITSVDHSYLVNLGYIRKRLSALEEATKYDEHLEVLAVKTVLSMYQRLQKFGHKPDKARDATIAILLRRHLRPLSVKYGVDMSPLSI